MSELKLNSNSFKDFQRDVGINIKFVSYSGVPYAYCSGVLVLSINDKDFNFHLRPEGVVWENYEPINEGYWKIKETNGFSEDEVLEIEDFINTGKHIELPCCGGCA